MARTRKPLTPEQRQRKNERAKQLYAERRAAGLSPRAAHAPRKAGVKLPQPSTVPTPSRSRRRRPAPPVKGVVPSPKERTSAEGFERFAARMLRANPNASARKIIDAYKGQGGTIGNDKGFKAVRDIKEADKQFEKARFKVYGPDDHPAAGKRFLFPKRFMYLVRYEVDVEGQPDSWTQYVYISSDSPLSASQIAMQTIEQFQIGQEMGKERYIARRIIPNSIVVLWGVDRFKKSAS